jgi:hypothetical protein
LARTDSAFYRLLHAAFRPIPVRTVAKWANRLELAPALLAQILLRSRLPPPKRALTALRLTYAVACGSTVATRDELAVACGYCSGAYLGRTCRAKLGLSLGAAIRRGPTVGRRLL